MMKCILLAWMTLMVQATLITGDVVYWQNHVESGDVVVPDGRILVLRGNNTVQGVLSIAAGGQVVVDPAFDTYMRVGTIDVAGELRIGTPDQPYIKKAIFELACNSPFPPPDLRRKAVVVRANGTLALFGAKGATSQTWTRLRETAQAGATSLTLDVPRGWSIGDEIVVPSTDFDPHQAEKRIIVGVTTTHVQLDRPLQYMHYGRVTEGVDERAEIGLLTRNIVFRGCMETDPVNTVVGGHMIFLEGFHQVQIQGIELQNFGQGDQLGRYPMHFHLCGVVPHDTFLRSNAIHESNFRVIVFHGTQGVDVERNVAFNITGHAVMLEDGAETNNTLRENLVVLVKEKLSSVRLGSDAEVALSAFYITNPNNTITDNVVAGVEGTGFWLDTRLEVKGLSFLTGKYTGLHPFQVPLGEIQRNVAHSVQVGFKIDSPNLDMLDYPQQIYSPPQFYSPVEMPVLRNFVVHHSRQGGWFRSYRITLDHWIVGDVTEGVQILSRGDTSTDAIETYVINSLFVGGTANRGNLVQTPWQWINYLENRSDSAVDRADDGRMAIKLYDGPMYLTNCTFRLWYSQPCLNVTNPAIGTRIYNSFLMSTAIVARELTFEQTDVRLAVSDRLGDGGISTSMVDQRGSISGYPGAILLSKWGYYATPNCVSSVSWGLACPQRYVNLDIVSVDANTEPTRYGKLNIYRNNVESSSAMPPSLSFGGQYIPASNGWLYHPIISPSASYTLQFEQHTPNQLLLRFSYTKAEDVFHIAVAYPPGSHITSVVNQDGGSLQRTRDTMSCINCYWYDPRGFLTITVQERAGPTGSDKSCSPLGCLSVVVKAVVPEVSSVSTAQIATILPNVVITDDKSNWRRQTFAMEAAALDQAVNVDWCNIDDPCLHAIDEGNAKMGILAYTQTPCIGVGCYSNTCRYCKLTFSAANVPFPGCPFDPNFVAPNASANPCSAFVSSGNLAAGVEVIHDTSCINGGGTNGHGCTSDQCRFCKTRETSLSSNFLNCSAFTPLTATPAPVRTAVTMTPATPLTPSPTTTDCLRLVPQGDSSAGISAITDTTCQFGGLGCFSAQCRFCKTRETPQSTHLMACTQSVASVVMAATTTSTPTPSMADTCWQVVSPGDTAAGLTAMADSTCQQGGLGCLSSSCQFCRVRETPQSAPYLPCKPSPSTTPTSPPIDACARLVSSGDVAVGITAVTQPTCGTQGGLGCVTDSCQYCKKRTTPQSAHLLNCTQLQSSGRSESLQVAATSTALSTIVINNCTALVSFGAAQLGISAYDDAACTNSSDDGCLVIAACRFCKYRETSLSTNFSWCPLSVTMLSSSPTCKDLPDMLALASSTVGIDEPRCNIHAPSLPGCIPFSSCRLCTTNTNTNTTTTSLPQCSALPSVTASQRNAAPSTSLPSSAWVLIICIVVSAACLIALVNIVAHKRATRPRKALRVATPHSLPRRSRHDAVDVVTLTHSDVTADFFVL